MSDLPRIVLGLGILYGALTAGYVARRRKPERRRLSAPLLRFALLYLDCPLIALIFWQVPVEQRQSLWQLPMVGFVLSLLLLPIGLAGARLARLARDEEGAFLCAATLSNIGYTYGGLLCLLFLGVKGVSLSGAYAMYMTPFTFMVMFQVAAAYASSGEAVTARMMMRQFLRDVARWLPILALIVGISLNFLAPRPPVWMKPILVAGVLVGTGAYSFAIGVSVRLGRIREHLRACLAVSAVKFAIAPLLALGLAALFRLDPLQRQVVFIESAMPVAIYAVVLSGLTGLPRDVANSCWIFTTLAALPLVLPIYLVVMRML